MDPIHFFQSLPSTNTIAREMAQRGAVHGTTIVAEEQTEGRGRLGKTWHSAAGKGLFCSIIVRPRNIDLHDYPKITLVAGLAVAKALDRLTGMTAQLKWPNDVLYAARKCAGILTESSAMTTASGERFAVVGIGINVLNEENDFPPELKEKVTSLLLETGKVFQVLQVLEVVRTSLIAHLETFSGEGFPLLLAEWRQRDFLLGKEMQFVSGEGEIIIGVALGPDGEGHLHARDRQGKLHSVLSGDVQLAKRKRPVDPL